LEIGCITSYWQALDKDKENGPSSGETNGLGLGLGGSVLA
jgi:hypothetical protein